MSAEHGPHIDPSNKRIALLVAVLAAFLAICETGGKSAQTEVLTQHVEAANLWTFFQAKTVRQTVLRTAAEALGAEYQAPADMPPSISKLIEKWQATAQRYETEPQTGEGRTELMVRAKMHEQKRERARAAYHLFEYGSAAFQLAIVLAGAAALTSVMALALVSGGLGVLGMLMTALGYFEPTLLHL